jgi:hypothetical protein
MSHFSQNDLCRQEATGAFEKLMQQSSPISAKQSIDVRCPSLPNTNMDPTSNDGSDEQNGAPKARGHSCSPKGKAQPPFGYQIEQKNEKKEGKKQSSMNSVGSNVSNDGCDEQNGALKDCGHSYSPKGNPQPAFGCQIEQKKAKREKNKKQSVCYGQFVAEFSKEKANVLHVKILDLDGIAVSWQEALAEMLKLEPSDFRDLITCVLREHVPFKAYFWECAPVSHELLRKKGAFEFALVDAPSLARNRANISPYKEYLEVLKGQPVWEVFQNPGRDCSLIAPAQATSDPEDYTHISAFFRGSAPLPQQDAAWQRLGHAISDELRRRDVVWVSTDGCGVRWLHFRVDARPKYFKMDRYCDPRFGL